jgi:predicted transcriptional regulator
MKEKIQQLLGQKVEFFDSTGDCLNFRAIHQPDWWNIHDMKISRLKKKFFEVTDLITGETVEHRYNIVKNVEGTEIVL